MNSTVELKRLSQLLNQTISIFVDLSGSSELTGTERRKTRKAMLGQLSIFQDILSVGPMD